MTIVVDANVAIKWFVNEMESDEAQLLKEIFDELVAPDYILIELLNVAWKKTRRGEIPATVGADILAAFKEGGPRLLPFGMVMKDAAEIAAELDHPVYDCLYVAAMDLLDGRLITADRKLYAKLAAGRFASRAYRLADVDRLIADVREADRT